MAKEITVPDHSPDARPRARRAAGLALALVVGLSLGLAFAAHAQELTGTLKKAKESGVLTIGYRGSSIPFSYLNLRRQPIGYSIDLCKEIVDEIAEELGQPVGVSYKLVTAENRIPTLLSGGIDIECGSTTSNFTRQKQVAFSPVFFVAGTKLLVRKSSGIQSYRDLGGKTVVVTSGTTNEAALRAIVEKQKIDIKIVTAADHDQSFNMVASGTADAFATDDVLLYGLIATAKNGADFHVVGEYLSYDPYGLMFRKDDPDFAAVVDRTFRRLAENREIVDLYNKWFQKRLPTGELLDLPISPQLEEFFRVLGVPEE
ncbi:MAG TPA: amino acid ABC transporter substrate-binding protein [Alphaproteobacteria bacterium]|nr:amino acid ABC transporter substrate-binding protein [Alphaproteobacteria bacterium]